jgi:glycosyltransferase involved in cell wall biosynthesis
MGSAFDGWFERMQSLLLQSGVEYYGQVNHVELAQQLSRAGFLLYPTTFPETGCITVMKAMAFGAIPITSRLTNSVLATLTRGFDLGPADPLDTRVVDSSAKLSQWLHERWVPAVLQAAASASASASSEEDGIARRRIDMMKHARTSFQWSATADIFVKAFSNSVEGQLSVL